MLQPFMESRFLFLSDREKMDRMRSGIAQYREASGEMGLSKSGWAWEARLADFDNDGVLEALQATGFTNGKVNRWAELQETALVNDYLFEYPLVWANVQAEDDVAGSEHNPFFVRAKDGRYYDLGRKIEGLGEPMVSRGIAPADIDGDGKLDFALANNWEPSFLFRNIAPKTGAYLEVHLRLPVGKGKPGATIWRARRPKVGDPLSRPAFGATTTVQLPDGRRLFAEVDGGTGHSGQRPKKQMGHATFQTTQGYILYAEKVTQQTYDSFLPEALLERR